MSELAYRSSPRKLPALLAAGILVIAVAVLLALFAPIVAPYDPILHDTSNTLKPPSLAHPFGTDNFGRDVFSRVIWGTRVDLPARLDRRRSSPSSSGRPSA